MFGNVTYHDFANALCNKLQGAERLYGLRTNLLWKDKETAHLIFEEVIYRKEHSFSYELDLLDYYCAYDDGLYSLTDLADDIQKNVKSIWSFHAYSTFSKFDEYKRRIFPRVLGVEQNSDYRSKYVYRDISGLDLMVTYYVELRRGITCAKKMIAYQDLMEWGISVEDLHRQAIDNMRRDREIEFLPLGEAIKSRIQAMYKDIPIPEELLMPMILEDLPVWVYDYKNSPYGATAILFGDKLQEIHDKLGDFCLVPSSTEEFLIIPTEMMEGVGDIVKEMNGQIGSGLVLSDKLYLVTNNRIEVVNE